MPDFSGGAPLWAKFVNGEESGRAPIASAWLVKPGATRLPPPEHADQACQLPYDWDKRLYAALDVETTGLDSQNDRVIEVGISLFHFDAEGALVDEGDWSTLVNPGAPIPSQATAIHGITDLDVSSAPFFHEIAEEVKKLLAGRVFVAHNAPFDSAFIFREFSRTAINLDREDIADSLVFTRLAFPNLLSYSLGRAAFTLGIDRGTSHRALDDARTCARLFALAARKLAGACP